MQDETIIRLTQIEVAIDAILATMPEQRQGVIGLLQKIQRGLQVEYGIAEPKYSLLSQLTREPDVIAVAPPGDLQ